MNTHLFHSACGFDPTRRPFGSRAFSLVEVLIAVFVLALGVLGLASIFPVVLREQRDAGEVAQARIAAGSIESLLTQNIELNRPGDAVGWGIFRADTGSNGQPSTTGRGWSPEGQWVAPALVTAGDPSGSVRMGVDAGTGLLRFYSDNGNGPSKDPYGDDVLFPLSTRLSPGPFLRGAVPRSEWIIAARRVISRFEANGDPVPTNQDRIQIAVFLRPIDRAIQVPRRDRPRRADWAIYGRSINLSDVLLGPEIKSSGGNAAASTIEFRRPVAVNRQTGLPTGNGVGDYALPFVLEIQPYAFDDNNAATNDDRDRLRFKVDGTGRFFRALSQIGQQFVDGRGNIYTVRGIDPADDTILLIDPPVSATVLRTDDLSPVVATPVIPLSVEVFTR